MQGEYDPMTGGETLLSTPKEKNKELLVYTKRKPQQKSIVQAQPNQVMTNQIPQGLNLITLVIPMTLHLLLSHMLIILLLVLIF